MRAQIGTVSEGTLAPFDLLVAFSKELSRLVGEDEGDYKALLDAACREWDEPSDDERADDLVYQLTEALKDFAPPYSFFGAHPDVGACFGFWPDEYAALGDDDVAKITVGGRLYAQTFFNGEAVEDEGAAYSRALVEGKRIIAFVNERGNTVLREYDDAGLDAACKGFWREVWSVV